MALIGPSEMNERVSSWLGMNLSAPIFFPSISSVKTQLSPLAYFQLINSIFRGKQFLISAYDLVRADEGVRSQFLAERAKSRTDKTLVLMDSGNYESYWHAPEKRWTATEYHDALSWFKPDLAFGFDYQDPPEREDDHIDLLLKQLTADRDASAGAFLIPIVHGEPAELPNLITQFATFGDLQAVAVPERCLGSSLFDRISTVAKIRRNLNSLGRHISVHLLGTGNPLSMALFSQAGADSFDGLEWCQTVVDYQSKQLHHFSHAALFLNQGRWAQAESSYEVKTLAHNLDFYGDWNEVIRQAVADSSVEELVVNSFPPYAHASCLIHGVWKNGK
ncbi:MAG: hypothetical protein PSV40_00415 [Polaromonas sp.]|uniref:hypothetical protein n=1 Tax=Polaromonas sp. TaxID=1869339 RepID=UPI00248A8E96|nr:hypothetical protein [Polaromonas sp.]MDI1267553.1 hypothetical protein [Polaromonas sp.]